MTPLPDFSSVTRFELIDHTRNGGVTYTGWTPGRAVVAYGVSVHLDVQDDGRTLKVFLSDPKPAS